MSAQKTKAAGHLAAIFTMLIWGTTFISTKVLLEDLSPLEILVLSSRDSRSMSVFSSTSP